jgi:hypothetical protein
LGSEPVPQPRPEQEQQQPPTSPSPWTHSPIFRPDTPSSQSLLPTPAPASSAQDHVARDQHQRAEERVMYTTSWPEPVPTSTTPNF